MTQETMPLRAEKCCLSLAPPVYFTAVKLINVFITPRLLILQQCPLHILSKPHYVENPVAYCEWLRVTVQEVKACQFSENLQWLPQQMQNSILDYVNINIWCAIMGENATPTRHTVWCGSASRSEETFLFAVQCSAILSLYIFPLIKSCSELTAISFTFLSASLAIPPHLP